MPAITAPANKCVNRVAIDTIEPVQSRPRFGCALRGSSGHQSPLGREEVGPSSGCRFQCRVHERYSTKGAWGAQSKPTGRRPDKGDPGSGFPVAEPSKTPLYGEFAALTAVSGLLQPPLYFLETSILHFRKNQTRRTISVRLLFVAQAPAFLDSVWAWGQARF